MFAFVKHIKVERQPKWCTREGKKEKKKAFLDNFDF